MRVRERREDLASLSVESQRSAKVWCRTRLAVAIACSLFFAGCDFFMDADARVTRAQQHIASSDYRAAMIDLKTAVQAEPKHVEGRLLLAEVSLQLGDAVSAEKELRFAIDSGATSI